MAHGLDRTHEMIWSDPAEGLQNDFINIQMNLGRKKVPNSC